jgi:hypothetical protein
MKKKTIKEMISKTIYTCETCGGDHEIYEEVCNRIWKCALCGKDRCYDCIDNTKVHFFCFPDTTIVEENLDICISCFQELDLYLKKEIESRRAART